ncbi:hypothetical protein AB0C96_04310 [Streptomyces sp. NPDC048506]
MPELFGRCGVAVGELAGIGSATLIYLSDRIDETRSSQWETDTT